MPLTEHNSIKWYILEYFKYFYKLASLIRLRDVENIVISSQFSFISNAKQNTAKCQFKGICPYFVSNSDI